MRVALLAAMAIRTKRTRSGIEARISHLYPALKHCCREGYDYSRNLSENHLVAALVLAKVNGWSGPPAASGELPDGSYAHIWLPEQQS